MSSGSTRKSLFTEESEDDDIDILVSSRNNSQSTSNINSERASILKDASTVSDSVLTYNKALDRPKVTFKEDGSARSRSTDQNESSYRVPPPSSSPMISKKASLCIRQDDETRIVTSLQKAARKQTTGSIYSVIVDISKSSTLDIGVKDLPENILAVSLLKRENDRPGAGEAAGIRLGDVIFGVNFLPVRDGSKTLITIMRLETEKKKKFIHIQAWRCHQLCSDAIPGYIFPRVDDILVRAFELYRTKVFTDWERWNFIEILLGHMVEDLHLRSQSSADIDHSGTTFSNAGRVRARQMQALDLERNILQAKGLRGTLNVRIVHTKNRDDAVTYVLRVEDVESGLVWTVHRRYNEFYTLYEELLEMTHFIKEIEFPKKRMTMRLNVKHVEQRLLLLESFLRKSIHSLTLYASMDSSASNALRRIQHFLSIEKHVDVIHPPLLDDQRTIEIMAFRFLNDFNSPACQQCVRFITSVDLENMVESGEDGYKGLLTFMHDALAEVEQFVQQQHEQQLLQTMKNRRPEWSMEQKMKLVRQCIRRQVEEALYLPLRRNVFKVIQALLFTRAKKLQHAIYLLQQAKPSVFMVDVNVPRTKSFTKAIKSLRKTLLAHLPSDQGQFLVETATIISELHTESKELSQQLQHQQQQAHSSSSKKNQLQQLQQLQQPMNTPTNHSSNNNSNSNNSNNNSNGSNSNGSSRRLSLLSSISPLTRSLSGARNDSTNGTGNGATVNGSNSPSRFLAGLTKSNSNNNLTNGGAPSSFSAASAAVPATLAFERRPSLQERIQIFVQSEQRVGGNNHHSNGHNNNNNNSNNSSGKQHNLDDSDDDLLILPSRSNGNDRDSDTQRVSFSISSSYTAASGSSMTANGSAAAAVLLADGTTPLRTGSRGSYMPKRDLDKLDQFYLESTSSSSKKSPHQQQEALHPLEDVLSPNSPVVMKMPPNQPQPPQPHQPEPSEAVVADPLTAPAEVAVAENGIIESNTSSSKSIEDDQQEQLQQEEEQKLAHRMQRKLSITGNSPTSSSSMTSLQRSRSLNRTSSKHEVIIDPLLRPPSDGDGNMMDEGVFAEVFDRYRTTYHHTDEDQTEDEAAVQNAISADDFLPLFTYVVVQAGVPNLLTLKELMTALIANEDAYGECGYYLATLEAAIQHILDLATSFQEIANNDGFYDDEVDMYEYGNMDL